MARNVDNALTKRAHIKQQWTEKHIQDMLECMNPTSGYIYFAKNFFHIQHPTRGKLLFEPFEYQIGLLNSYHTRRFNINMLPRQSGKALALDTPIPTPTGWTTMGDIKVGDVIFGPDGKTTTVTFATEVMYNRPCYDITFDSGEHIVADAEHLWKVYSPGTHNTDPYPNGGIITTEELLPIFNKQHNVLHIKTAAPLEYEHKDLPIHPYVLGLWIADDTQVPRTSMNQLKVDQIEIATSLKELGYAGFTDKNLCTELAALNLIGNKHIPDIYMQSSIEQRLELLAGILDKDGVHTSTGIMYSNENLDMCNQVKQLLWTLGIKPQTTEQKSDEYFIKFRFKTNLPVFKLTRKNTPIKVNPRSQAHYFRSITPIDSVPVRCIQVDNPDHMFLCGKSLIPTHNTTCASAYLLWYAMFHPDQTILVAAHKFTGAQEIMQRIRYGYELCPDYLRAGVVSYNKGSMEFDNGSRIISQTTTGTTGRGLSISLLYCDEFAFVQPNIANEFWTSISPTLATGGRAIITSTPNSDEDQFALIWKESKDVFDEYGNERTDGLGRNGFFGYKSDWWDHPDRDEQWKKEELGRIGEERFRREYNCEFLVYDETLINSIKLTELLGRDPLFKMGEVRWYKQPTPGNLYMVALDPCLGTGGDYAGIEVFELPSFTQVAEWQHNITPIHTQCILLREVLKYIQDTIGIDNTNSIYWSIENNSVGDSALITVENLGEESFPGLFLSEPLKKGHVKKFRKGFNTTFGNKISSCARLKFLIEEDKMKINSRAFISELKTFIASGVSFKAKPGHHDDLVSSVLLVVRMSSVLAEWDPNVFETLSIEELDTDWEPPLPVYVSTY